MSVIFIPGQYGYTVVMLKNNTSKCEQDSKALGIIRGSSIDSLNQDQQQLQSDSMDNKQNMYYSPQNPAYQTSEDNCAAQESSLQYILSPQMTKRLAHIAPPTPLYATKMPGSHRHNSMTDSNSGMSQFAASTSSQLIYQSNQQYQQARPSSSNWQAYHDLPPSSSAGLFYVAAPSGSHQTPYTTAPRFHFGSPMPQQRPAQHRPLSAYAEAPYLYHNQYPSYPGLMQQTPVQYGPPAGYLSGPIYSSYVQNQQQQQQNQKQQSQHQMMTRHQQEMGAVAPGFLPSSDASMPASSNPQPLLPYPPHVFMDQPPPNSSRYNSAPIQQHRPDEVFNYHHSSNAFEHYNSPEANFEQYNNTGRCMPKLAIVPPSRPVVPPEGVVDKVLSVSAAIAAQNSNGSKVTIPCLTSKANEKQQTSDAGCNVTSNGSSNNNSTSIQNDDNGRFISAAAGSSNSNNSRSSPRNSSSSNQEADQALIDSPRHQASGGNRYHCGAKMELEHGRTPLFGQCPVWWGENKEQRDDDGNQLQSTVFPPGAVSSTSTRRSTDEAKVVDKRTATADEEKLSDNTQTPEHSDSSPRFRRQNIRMDIPFSSEDKDATIVNKRRSGPGALAFTIDFTSTEVISPGVKKRNSAGKADENKAELQWKLQSAERLKQNFLRRSTRKAGTEVDSPKLATASKVLPPVGSGTEKESKKFLLDKMLNNFTGEPLCAASNAPPRRVVSKSSSKKVSTPPSVLSPTADLPQQRPTKKESYPDNESDAGTFVIERSQEEMMARLRIDQVFGINDQYLSSSSSQESLHVEKHVTDAVIKPRTILKPALKASEKSKQNSDAGTSTCQDAQIKTLSVKGSVLSQPKSQTAANPVSRSASSDEASKKGLINELAKINKNVPSSSSTSGHSSSTGAIKPSTPQMGKKFCQGSPSQTKASPRSSSFGRNDAGRFSLRAYPGPGPGSSNPKTVSSSDFSAGTRRSQQKGATNSTTVSGQQKQRGAAPAPPQKSNELNLWLRRKEYNPMKAAAQARMQKMTQIKQEDEPQYLSNRSQSFHTGNYAGTSKLSLKRHQSIENNNSCEIDVQSDEPNSPLDEDADCIGNKYTVTFLDDHNSDNRLTRAKSTEKVYTNSLQNISKLTHELGSHAQQLLHKLNQDQGESSKEINVSSSPAADSQLMSSDKIAARSSQFDDLVRRLELANKAFEVVDKYLKDQSEKMTNVPGNMEPSDPTSTDFDEAVPGRTDFTVRRISKTKL